MATYFFREHTIALRSAVDLLTGSCSPEYVEHVLRDYRHGGSRSDTAKSLYKLIDAIEQNQATFVS